MEEGHLDIDDPPDGFRLLYGLIVQDWQIRGLLGESRPGPQWIDAQAALAVRRFWR